MDTSQQYIGFYIFKAGSTNSVNQRFYISENFSFSPAADLAAKTNFVGGLEGMVACNHYSLISELHCNIGSW